MFILINNKKIMYNGCMIKKILTFFDRLEDHVRGTLSNYPILYASIVSVGMILFWRGIWHTADNFFISGPLSIFIGITILLITGIFVSGFIGNRILLTGIKNEKKLTEKTKKEIERDMQKENKSFKEIENTLHNIEEKIDSLEKNR